ncbi:uncharacterized protein LOC143230552 isoform X2 [Tachypleus tridentatus]
MLLVLTFLAFLLRVEGQQQQVFFTPPLANYHDVDNNRNPQFRPILENPPPTDRFYVSHEPTNTGFYTSDRSNGFSSKGYDTPNFNDYYIRKNYYNQKTPSFSGFRRVTPTKLDRKSTGRFQFDVPNIKDNFNEGRTAFGRKPTSIFLRKVFINNSKLKSSNKAPKSTDRFITPSIHNWTPLTDYGIKSNSHNQNQQRKPTLVNGNRKPLVYFDDDEPLSKAFETPSVQDSSQKIRTPSSSTARPESQFNHYDHLKDMFFREGNIFSRSFKNPRFPSTAFRNNQHRPQENSNSKRGRGSFSAQITKELAPNFRDSSVSTRRNTSSLQEEVVQEVSPTPEKLRDVIPYQINQSHNEHNGETGSKFAYRVVYLPYETIQQLLRRSDYKRDIEV